MAFTLFLLSLLATSCIALFQGGSHSQPSFPNTFLHGTGPHFGGNGGRHGSDDYNDNDNDGYDDYHPGGRGNGGRQHRDMLTARAVDKYGNKMELTFQYEDDGDDQHLGHGQGPATQFGGYSFLNHNILGRNRGQQRKKTITVTGQFTASDQGQHIRGSYYILIAKSGNVKYDCVGTGPLKTARHDSSSSTRNPFQNPFGTFFGQQFSGFSASPYGHGNQFGHFGSRRPKSQYLKTKTPLYTEQNSRIHTTMEGVDDLNHMTGCSAVLCPAHSPPNQCNDPYKRPHICAAIVKDYLTIEEFEEQQKHLKLLQQIKQQSESGHQQDGASPNFLRTLQQQPSGNSPF